jgi:hypothetical protein
MQTEWAVAAERRCQCRTAWYEVERAIGSPVCLADRSDLVIPHVVLPRIPPIGKERSAFARGTKERELRVVVDRATVPEGIRLSCSLDSVTTP